MKKNKMFRAVGTGLLLAMLLFQGCGCGNGRWEQTKTPVDYVNPNMGNISHLLVPTYPTVQLPNGMLRVYPKREIYTSDLLAGLPLAVTGHRGISAFRLDPVSCPEAVGAMLEGLSYTNERTTPYHYSVFLDDVEVDVDFAPAYQSAIYQLSFHEGNAHLAFTTADGTLEMQGNVLTASQRIGKATVYLYMEMEQKPVAEKDLSTRENIKGWVSAAGYIGSKGELRTKVISFDTKQVNLRYGISFISKEQARENLYREIPHYDVEALANAGRDVWNETLGQIQVSGLEEDAKTVFYTSLYRTYERMINISEDGKYYSGFDGQVHEDEGVPFYTDDWIWDTYHAVHPLRVILEPKKEAYMLQSFVRMAQQSEDGWLPTFPGVQGDSHSMNGNHGIVTLWDAYVKGVQDFDIVTAYVAARKTLDEKSIIPWRRVPKTELDEVYSSKGFFPALYPGEKEWVKEVDGFERRQAVAVTLADCHDSWCLAQMAQKLGKETDYVRYMQRSYNYRNLYNARTGFFHPKDQEGKFIEPFDYVFSGGPGNRDYYDENNGWIYRWDVVHNIYDLMELMGGKEQFVNNLDQTFREPLGKGRNEFYYQNADHTGNVGQYSMGNEPCMHIPYLYCYGGEAWKTQKRVRTLLQQWFRNDLMGVPGDEDGGGLSSFVVFSMLGFYPVTPGVPVYVIGSPVFETATIALDNGKTFTVRCHDYSPEHKFIQSAKLNGENWDQSWFSHDDLMQGGTLEFVMGKYPNKMWAQDGAPIPPVPGNVE